MDCPDILARISEYPARHVVITGGEPALQLDASLIDRLHDAGWYVQVETNGTLPLPDNIDWITCSPKTDRIACGRVDEIKLLYMADGHDDDRATRFGTIQAQCYSMQPCDCSESFPEDAGEALRHNMETLRECIDYVKAHPRWRLSLQTHKMLGIR